MVAEPFREHFNWVHSRNARSWHAAVWAHFGRSIKTGVRELQRHRVRVAVMCHGSEIRLPGRHVATHAHSPFTITSVAEVKVFERHAVKNREILDALGVPVFISTPALKVDVPYGAWVPVVVDSGRWATDRIPLETIVPVVEHAPSRAILKRSDLIDEPLKVLEQEGKIVYHRLSGIPNAEMPKSLESADIFIDAVGTGNYGVAGCEAMASGCVVVSYIADQVADFVESETGMTLPIVHTEPDEVSGTIRKILRQRGYYQAIAQQGREFVKKWHSGEYAASVLRPFLTEHD